MTFWHYGGDVKSDDVTRCDVTSNDVTRYGIITDDDVTQCTLCDSAGVGRRPTEDCALQLIGTSNSLQHFHQRHHHQTAGITLRHPERPAAAIDQPVPASHGSDGRGGDVSAVKGSAARVVNSCHPALSDASVHYYDVAMVERPMDGCRTPTRRALYNSQICGVGLSRRTASSAAAVVQPYCHLPDNTDNTPVDIDTTTPGFANTLGLDRTRPQVPGPDTDSTPSRAILKTLGRSSVRSRASSRPLYATQTLDNPYSHTTRNRDHVIQRLQAGAKPTFSYLHLSKSCPNIRLVSTAGRSQRALSRHAGAMSTFGKCRPAMHYTCTAADDCSCSLELAEKFFGFENSVYFGAGEQDADWFKGGVGAMSHQTCQSTYGAVQGTTHGSAARVRAFLSRDGSDKHGGDRVVCETTRLNSAVCKPIITTRHHKVSFIRTLLASFYVIFFYAKSQKTRYVTLLK